VLALAAERRLGDRLLIVGHEAELAGVLSATDIFLSTSAYEGFGMAILEAMASSVPVVATSVGGVPYLVVSGTTGILVAPEDTNGLVAAVLKLVDAESLRVSMGTAGHARAAEFFGANRMIAAYEDLYRVTAASRQTGRPRRRDLRPRTPWRATT
jgi:glycosyltransferase involved in cell wall biosynthesis